MAFICLVVSTNTHTEPVNTLPSGQKPSQAADASGNSGVQSVDVNWNVKVLSAADEKLYRDIFSAQAKADWKGADAAIARLDNQGLMGHVLADRYARKPASSSELKAWLASYSTLPEADEVYEQASALPDFKNAQIMKPSLNYILIGDEAYGTSLTLKADSLDDRSPASSRFFDMINSALRHGNPEKAENTLYAEMAKRSMPPDELADALSHVAAGFFYAGAMQQAHDLSSQAMSRKIPLALWIAGLTAWKQDDTHAAADAFVTLANQPDLSPSDKSAAAFWAWRALDRNGDTAQARKMLEQAAQQPRNFYGLLAASLIGSNQKAWSWDLPPLSVRNLGVLAKTPVGWRALALIQIDQKALAESELQHMNAQGQHDLQNAMLALAENNQMPSLAIQLGSLMTNENGKHYDAALYPVPPWQPEKGFRIDRALLFALMRRESYFDPTAVSERGACGLMQLMPKTANLVAERKVAGEDCSGPMLNPSFNMALGQEYVRRLSEQPMIGDNLMFLLAAYNGGPGKLVHWMDQKTINDPLLFVESLPLHETRDYVQQVLMHYWTYRARLDEPTTSMAQLAKGEWPRYALREEIRHPKNLKTAKKHDFEVASSDK